MIARSRISMLIVLAIMAVYLWPQTLVADDRTVGLIKRDTRAYNGYTLYKPLGGTSVYLINNAGNLVHKWTIPTPAPLTTRPGGEVFLRENGELILTADEGIYALNPDNTLAWKIDSRFPGTDRWYGHHEFVELPNGNMLLPGFIIKTRAEAEVAGFDVTGADACNAKDSTKYPKLNELRVDNIWELAPTDRECGFACGWQVVWRWNLWDHFIQDGDSSKNNYVTNISDYPGKSDIGYIDPAEGTCGQFIQGAWTFGRFNAIGYHADRNEIVMSESLKNEIWIINHKITTEEAKGPAGDLLYRWGNPYAYGMGTPFQAPDNRGDQKLSFQHRVMWIAPDLPGRDNILIFNNGTDWGDSSVIEIRPPIDIRGNYKRLPGQPFGPKEPVWQYDEYDTPGSFFASAISSAQRLPNGDTLINNGMTGYIFEVTPRGEKVWEYVSPASGEAQGGASFSLYRAWRYPPNYQGLSYLDLTPGDPLEKYPNTYFVDIKPRTCENAVNRKSTEVLQVVILGAQDLDVTTIDPSSILLEGFPPRYSSFKSSVKDIGAPGVCDGKDGYLDLLLRFDSSIVKAALANASQGDEFVMRLTGYSSGGWFLGKEKVFIQK